MQARLRSMLDSLERATRKNDELLAAVKSLKQHRKLGDNPPPSSLPPHTMTSTHTKLVQNAYSSISKIFKPYIGFYGDMFSVAFHRRGVHAGPANRITGTAAAGKSRFWRAPGGVTPALNADAIQLLGVFKYLPHTFDQRIWAAEEDSKLREVVIAQVKVTNAPPAPFHNLLVQLS